MPDAVEVLQGGPRLPGIDADEPGPLAQLSSFEERVPSYEQLVGAALEHHLAQSQKKLREEVEEHLASKTDLLEGTDEYVAKLEATVGRRLAFRAHWLACGASEALEQLAAIRQMTLAELAQERGGAAPAAT